MSATGVPEPGRGTATSARLNVPASPASASSKRSRSRDSSATSAGSYNTTGANTPLSGSSPSLLIPQSASARASQNSVSEGYNTPASQDSTPYPAFLRLSRSEIQAKWVDLEWEQRQRLMQGLAPTKQPRQEAKVLLPAGSGNSETNEKISAAMQRMAKEENPWAKCSGEEVLNRNRYANVDPYASNRVKLVVPEGHSDYINASPIVLESKSGKKTNFIATQGPKSDILSHIYRMTYHSTGPPTNPAVIIMLTQTHESGKEKCYPYFPLSPSSPILRINPHNEFGDGFAHDVKLVKLTESEEARTQIRELEMVPVAEVPEEEADGMTLDDAEMDTGVQDNKESEIREDAGQETKKIWHLLFGGWPDFLVPSGADRNALLNLITLSRTLASTSTTDYRENPRIVHCSAGVGRSGTFIALDFLLQELEDGALDNIPDDEDPIFNTVDKLRKQRMMMVQGDAQLTFIYDLLRDCWRERWAKTHGEEAEKLAAETGLETGPRLKKVKSNGEEVDAREQPAGDEDERAEAEAEGMDTEAGNIGRKA